jgi:hypothetical protein
MRAFRRRRLHALVRPLHYSLPGGPVSAEDRRAALVLLVAMLGYGVALQMLSGVPLRALLNVMIIYDPMALLGMLIVALLTVSVWLLTPASRRNVQTRLFWLIVAGSVAWLMFPFFAMFKQMILPTRGFPWDRTFAHVGRWLLGVSPWTLVHAMFGTMNGARLLDFLYSIWLPMIFLFPMVVAAAISDAMVRFRLLLSWVGGWVAIGTIAAWAFASAGPIYFNSLIGPDRSYALLQLRLAELAKAAAAQGTPIAAVQFQPKLLEAFRLHDYAPAGGISAMPSMHVAMATLLAIAGFTRNRAWGLLFTLYALLIWAGSIFFGWHYFVDGPVAALMMAGVWQASGSLARRVYRSAEGGVVVAGGAGAAAAAPGAAGTCGGRGRAARPAPHGEDSPRPSPPHLRNFFESTWKRRPL